MDNYEIMLTMKKSTITGKGYTEVQVMDFSRGRIWYINFHQLENESLPESLREFVRKNSKKILEGSWHYNHLSRKNR